MTKRRWTADELAVLSDLSIEAEDVALELGRTVAAVKTLRKRLARGWAPRQPHLPLTVEHLDFIASHPEMTARTVATELGVRYSQVTRARRELAQQRGISFGNGPYDKDPFAVGSRTLLGKTCRRCGVLRGGAEFNRSGVKVSAVCRFCKAETRRPDDRQARENEVRALAKRVRVPYRAHHAEEYTTADMDVLADPTLTIAEKAARLGRTYAATSMAVQVHGFSSKIEPRVEPRGVWVIDGVTSDLAQAEPDRSQFGSRPRKTHCKWGHELTPDNLYYPKNRAPDCLTCRQVRSKGRAKASAS